MKRSFLRGFLSVQSRFSTMAFTLAVVLVAGAMFTNCLAGDDGSIRARSGRVGTLSVDVDTAACLPAPSPCAGFPARSAAATNSTPVRLLIQVESLEPFDDLTPGTILVETQFTPSGEGEIARLDCDGCFEHEAGGIYALWVAPQEGNWQEGSYWLLVRIATGDAILPALARIDIPATATVPNMPPEADAGPNLEGTAGLSGHCSVRFNACRSIDHDGAIVAYRWCIQSMCQMDFEDCQFEWRVAPTGPKGTVVTVTAFDNGDGSTQACTSPNMGTLDDCPTRGNDSDTTTVICHPWVP